MIAFWISLANPSCPSAPNLAPIREKYGVVENIIPGEVRQAKMHKVSDIRLQPPDGSDQLLGFSPGLTLYSFQASVVLRFHSPSAVSISLTNSKDPNDQTGA